jgi:hypothetical protein
VVISPITRVARSSGLLNIPRVDDLSRVTNHVLDHRSTEDLVVEHDVGTRVDVALGEAFKTRGRVLAQSKQGNRGRGVAGSHGRVAQIGPRMTAGHSPGTTLFARPQQGECRGVWSHWGGCRHIAPWRRLAQGRVVAETPRHEMLRDTMNHWAHHRGQMTVYLRLMGAKVPALYGPSADDKRFD